MDNNENRARRENWLKNLKTGDRVILLWAYSGTRMFIDTIIGDVTPKRTVIKVGGRRFNGTKDGDEIGSRYSSYSIQEPNDYILGEMADVEAEKERWKMFKSINVKEIERCSIEALEQIQGIIASDREKRLQTERERDAQFDERQRIYNESKSA